MSQKQHNPSKGPKIKFKQPNASSRGGLSPQVVFDREVETIIAGDGFVDIDVLFNRLSSQIHYPASLRGYAEIQNFNRIINNAVSAYIHSQSIQTFCDLEEFVLGNINAICKISPKLSSFSEVGVGNLEKHPKVLEKFRFYNPAYNRVHRWNFPSEVVWIAASEFIDKRFKSEDRYGGNYFRKNYDAYDQPFKEYLCNKMQLSMPIFGLEYDLRSLFLGILKAKSKEAYELRRNNKQLSKEYKDKVTIYFSRLREKDFRIGKFVSESRIEMLENVFDQVKSSRIKLKEDVFALRSFIDPLEPYHKLLEKFRSLWINIKSISDGSAAYNEDIFFDESSNDDASRYMGLLLASADGKLSFKNSRGEAILLDYLSCTKLNKPRLKHFEKLVVNSVVNLLLFVTTQIDVRRRRQSVSSLDEKLDSLSELDGPLDITMIRDLLYHRIATDIPDSSFDHSMKLLLKLIPQLAPALSIDKIRDTFSVDINVNDAISRVQNAVKGNNQDGNSFLLDTSTYIAAVTCTILWLRIANTVEYKSIAAVEDYEKRCKDLLLSKVNDMSLKSSDEIGLRGVIAILLSLENEVKIDQSVPAFECLGLGSFLSFAYRVCPMIIQELKNLNLTGLHNQVLADSNRYLETPEIDVAYVNAQLSQLSDCLNDHITRLQNIIDSNQQSTTPTILEILKYLESELQSATSISSFETSIGLSFLSALSEIFKSNLALETRFHSLLTASLKPNLLEESLVSFEQEMNNNINSQEVDSTTFEEIDPLLREVVFDILIQETSEGPHHQRETFVSKEAIIDRCVSVIADTFKMPRKHVSSMVTNLVTAWTEDGSFPLDSLSGTCADSTQRSAVPFLKIAHPMPELVLKEEDKFRSHILTQLMKAPLGYSCVEFSMWNAFACCQAVGSSATLPRPTFLGFMLQNRARLEDARPEVVYYAFPAEDDCVAIPKAAPLVSELVGIVERSDSLLLSAYVLSAFAGIVNRIDFEIDFAATLKQTLSTRGDNAIDFILELSLSTTYHLMTRTNSPVYCLGLFLDSLADACKSVRSIMEQELVTLSLSNIRMHRFIKCLFALGMKFPVSFPLLHGYAKNQKFDEYVAVAYESVYSRVNNGGGEDLAVLALESNPTTDGSHIPGSVVRASTTGGIVYSKFESMDSTESNQCKEFVQRLLIDNFEYGLDGSAPDRASPNHQRFSRTLSMLAQKLYSSQVHFVMELVQNADDNTYAESVVPTLRFELYPQLLVVLNNEIGFSGANISAICDSGNSTKKGRRGYIGQKGIGFKSVFAVSDRPEVHSKGFHIMFDKSVSMIEPSWIDSDWPSKRIGADYFETCLRLKLNEKSIKNITELTSKLEDAFDDKLLLFVNKLERMVFENRRRGEASLSFTRYNLSDNWMRISSEHRNYLRNQSTEGTSNYFWLIKKRVFDPQLVRNEETDNGEVCNETTVCLGFRFIESRRAKRAFDEENDDDADHEKEEESDEDEDNLFDNESYNDKSQHLIKGELVMDLPDSLMPVYAYLPTNLHFFKFVVQADFLLPTSRESILEESPWNEFIFQKIPELFVEFVSEMSAFVWRGALSEELTSAMTETEAVNDPSIFTQLSEYDVKLTVQDLFNILPRRSVMSSSVWSRIVDSIYQRLHSMPFIRSHGGAICKSSELYTVHHLNFLPSEVLSEEELFDLTGRRYACNEDDSGFPLLDDQLAESLQIPKLDQTAIVKCLEAVAYKYCQSGNPPPGVIALISRLLILLDILTRSTHQPSHNKASQQQQPPPRSTLSYAHASDSKMMPAGNKLVPSQLLRKSSHSLGISTNGLTSGNLSIDVVHKLKRLRIWPVVSGQTISIENQVIFLHGTKTSANGPTQNTQSNCLKLFENHLQMIDECFFSAAKDLSSYTDNKVFTAFLTTNFRPAASLGSRTAGGLDCITPELVIKTVILPEFRRGKAVDSDSTDSAQLDPARDSLDRSTAAAMLAYFYLSIVSSRISVSDTNNEIGRALRDNGVKIPVLEARESSSELRWTNSKIVNVKSFNHESQGCPDWEVHLGLEFKDSASTILTKSNVSTALRQLKWTIVDPLVPALIFGRSIHVLESGETALSSTAIRALFDSCPAEELEKWKLFLSQIGVVNLFGVYNLSGLAGDGSGYQAPFLFRFMGHLLRNGSIIATSRYHERSFGAFTVGVNKWVELQSDEPEDNEDSKLAIERSPLIRDYIPIYLPRLNESSICGQALSVTKNVYDIMLELVPVIIRDLENMARSQSFHMIDAKSFLMRELNQRAWCPAAFHPATPLYKVTIHDSLEEAEQVEATERVYLLVPPKCLLGKTRFGVDHERKPMFLGPQFAYFPDDGYTKLGKSYEKFCKYFNVIEGSSTSIPELSLLTGLVAWMSEQLGRKVLSSRKIMKWVYETIWTQSGPEKLSDQAVLCFLNLITADKPLLWIPDVVPDTSAPAAGESYEVGEVYPLSQCVVNDRSGKFIFANSPVKVISAFYDSKMLGQDDHGHSFLQKFARVSICNVCRAVEGMFGARGLPLGKPVNHYPNKCCTCQDVSSFGILTSERTGLVKNMPSLLDIIELTRYYRDEYLRGSRSLSSSEEDMHTHTTASVAGETADSEGQRVHKNAMLAKFVETMTIISQNMWKCLFTQRCLIPYPAEHIRRLVTAFQEDSLIPTLSNAFISVPAGKKGRYSRCSSSVGGESEEEEEEEEECVLEEAYSGDADDGDEIEEDATGSVPAAGRRESRTVKDKKQKQKQKKLIWADDLAAFEMFRLGSELQDIDWVGVQHSDSAQMALDTMIADLSFVVNTNPDAYNIDIIDENAHELMMLPQSAFESATRSIPRETFLAPKDLSTLFKVLQIPSLSEYITTAWDIAPRPDLVDTAVFSFTSLMNNLLLLTRNFFHNKRQRGTGTSLPLNYLTSASLGSSPKLKELMNMRVLGCDKIQRRIELSLHGLRGKQERDESFHFERSNEGEITLYLMHSISLENIQSLCVRLLLRYVKMVVAMQELNQHFQLMDSFEAVLVKFSRVGNQKFEDFLSFDGLLESPSDLVEWRMTLMDSILKSDSEAAAGGGDKGSGSGSDSDSGASGAEEIDPQLAEDIEERIAGFRKLKAIALEKAAQASSKPGKAKSKPVDEELLKYLQNENARTAVAVAVTGAELSAPGNAELYCLDASSAVAGTGSDDPAASASNNRNPVVPNTSRAIAAIGELLAQRALPGYDSRPVRENSYERDSSTDTDAIIPNSSPWAMGNFANITESTDPSVLSPYYRVNDASAIGDRSLHENSSGWSPLQQSLMGSSNSSGDHVVVNLISPAGAGTGSSDEAQANILQSAISDHQQMRVDSLGDGSVDTQNWSNAIWCGQIGERIAWRTLCKHFLSPEIGAKPTAADSLLGSLQCTGIEWVNEHGETGQPYDMILTFADGSKRVCEVKTRVVSRKVAAHASQFFISPREIIQANELQQFYFCALVVIAVGSVDDESATDLLGSDAGGRAARAGEAGAGAALQRLSLIGLDTGLIASFATGQTHLIIQVNNNN